MFSSGELPRKKWPRHMIYPDMLESLYKEAGYSLDWGTGNCPRFTYQINLDEPMSKTENSCNFF